jgi:hypothetical protein
MKKIVATIKTIFLEIRLIFLSTNQELVIVTGSSSSHFKSLQQLLKSLFKHEFKTKIIVYDLGLLKKEREAIKKDFPEAELRLFDYAKYPNHFNINVNDGGYAWKPVIISDVLNEFKCSVCWLDGGNVLKKPLVKLRKIIELYGFYSPFSKGVIKGWTHSKTLEYLNVSNNKNVLNQTNLNGACVGVNYNFNKVKSLIDLWKECALTKDCIAPEGSSRLNHRFDQAVLSVIAYRDIPAIVKNMTFKRFGFKIHQDID